MATPPKVDLTKLTPARLRDLMRRYTEAGYPELAQGCLDELHRTGAARASDHSHLKWNQASASKALQPFVEVSKSVADNARTAFTEAGGTKIGKAKDDPERNWVDSYTAIKRGPTNAIFVCYIKAPGDDPSFSLQTGGTEERRFNFDQLDEALARWREIAASARLG